MGVHLICEIKTLGPGPLVLKKSKCRFVLLVSVAQYKGAKANDSSSFFDGHLKVLRGTH